MSQENVGRGALLHSTGGDAILETYARRGPVTLLLGTHHGRKFCVGFSRRTGRLPDHRFDLEELIDAGAGWSPWSTREQGARARSPGNQIAFVFTPRKDSSSVNRPSATRRKPSKPGCRSRDVEDGRPAALWVVGT